MFKLRAQPQEKVFKLMSMLKSKNINNVDAEYVFHDNHYDDLRLSFDYKSFGKWVYLQTYKRFMMFCDVMIFNLTALLKIMKRNYKWFLSLI